MFNWFLLFSFGRFLFSFLFHVLLDLFKGLRFLLLLFILLDGFNWFLLSLLLGVFLWLFSGLLFFSDFVLDFLVRGLFDGALFLFLFSLNFETSLRVS